MAVSLYTVYTRSITPKYVFIVKTRIIKQLKYINQLNFEWKIEINTVIDRNQNSLVIDKDKIPFEPPSTNITWIISNKSIKIDYIFINLLKTIQMRKLHQFLFMSME